MVAANARTAITFSLSPGQAHDAPAGRALLTELGPMPESLHLGMDRAYEDGETRQRVLDLGMIPVAPTKANRIEPWEYDRALYRKRNEIERLFRRLKGFRRIFSRFEKLDVLFLRFLYFALIVEALRVLCVPRTCAERATAGRESRRCDCRIRYSRVGRWRELHQSWRNPSNI
jgi:transposase